MKVDIVTLHYKNQSLVDQCLTAIKRMQLDNLELKVIVVNNNPQENLTKLKNKYPDFEFLEAGENLGFAEGNNLGLKQALDSGAKYFLLLNNDALVGKDLLVNLIKSMELNKQIGIVSPKIYFAPGYEFHHDRYQEKERGKVIWYAGGKMDWQNLLVSHRGVDEVDHAQYEECEETDFATGCAMLIKREVFEKIGLLDGKYFLYLEDLDFCQRAKNAGFKVFYNPFAIVWHLNAGSSEVGGGLHDYYITRNRLLFGLRYAPLRTKFSLVKESLRLLFYGRSWQRKGVADFYLGKLGRGSYR